MVDTILLALLIATTVLFIALALDEVISRMGTRRSDRTSLLPPNELAKQPTNQSLADDGEREAA